MIQLFPALIVTQLCLVLNSLCHNCPLQRDLIQLTTAFTLTSSPRPSTMCHLCSTVASHLLSRVIDIILGPTETVSAHIVTQLLTFNNLAIAQSCSLEWKSVDSE